MSKQNGNIVLAALPVLMMVWVLFLLSIKRVELPDGSYVLQSNIPEAVKEAQKTKYVRDKRVSPPKCFAKHTEWLLIIPYETTHEVNCEGIPEELIKEE